MLRLEVLCDTCCNKYTVQANDTIEFSCINWDNFDGHTVGFLLDVLCSLFYELAKINHKWDKGCGDLIDAIVCCKDRIKSLCNARILTKNSVNVIHKDEKK